MNPDEVPPDPAGLGVRITPLHQVVFRTVQRYGGVPLSCADIEGETRIPHITALVILQELHYL